MARRYLFSKKRHNAINIISIISVVGVALATTALVCTMSVFNGFQDLISTLFTTFDPQLEITPATGKFVRSNDAVLEEIRKHPQVASASDCLEDNAMILVKGHPLVFQLKGVSDNYTETTDITNIIYAQEGVHGQFKLHSGGKEYGTPGIGLASTIGSITFDNPQAPEVYVPKKGERIDITNPISSFNYGTLNASGVCFQVHQRKYDDNYMLTSLQFAQDLFDQNGMISSLELRLKEGASTNDVKEDLRKIAGNRFLVRDRMEQQEDTFRIMNIEKMVAYLFLTFIVLVACFNIIGSVSMLIIDKREDVGTLRHLGATDHDISRVFLLEGRFIALLGAVIGILIGVGLCYAQEYFGFIKIGSGNGNFIVEAYPVSVHLPDVLIIFATVCLVGFVSVWYPVRFLSKRLTSEN